MLMKWEDLEPGDKVKISKETLEKRGWGSYLKDKVIIIKEISFNSNNDYICIYCKCEYEYNDLRFVINKNTGASQSYNYKDIPLFEIVELKED